MANETKKTRRTTQKRRKATQSPTKPLQKKVGPEKGISQKEIQRKFEIGLMGHRLKYFDIGDPLHSGRLNKHWFGAKIVPHFLTLREGGNLPASFSFYDHQFLMEYFGLRGWEFGNWTSQEDRLLYVCGVGIALYDLNKVLGFKNEDIGLANKMTMAIGARGRSRALAHFEPGTFAINLTRYQEQIPSAKTRPSASKARRFLQTGGVSTLAHEYGHALDYFFGGYVHQSHRYFALSKGVSTSTQIDKDLIKKGGLRGLMEQIMMEIIWEDYDKKIHTRFYTELKKYLKDYGIQSPYYIQRNELFARFFENYINYELQLKGIKNAFLNKKKYLSVVYQPPEHIKKMAPTMRKFITQMRKSWNTSRSTKKGSQKKAAKRS